MDQFITIDFPILIANQGFRVEYRIEGTTPWILFGVVTTNSFTVTGLASDTCYEFRFTFLQSLSPLVECDSRIKKYCTPEEMDCIDISVELTRDDEGLYYLSVTPVFPSPFSGEPCGGYELHYGDLQGLNTIVLKFPSFLAPGYNPLVIPAQNFTYLLTLYQLDCFGNLFLCDQIDIGPVDEELIQSMVESEIEVINGLYYIKLTVTPSDPANLYFASYTQHGNPIDGLLDVGGATQFNATGDDPEIFRIELNPNLNTYPVNGDQLIEYSGSITDGTNTSHFFSVSYIVE